MFTVIRKNGFDSAEGARPVWARGKCVGSASIPRESRCLSMQRKAGRKLDLRLNISTEPIVNKYREGKLKSTLKRESKDRETVQSISQW